MNLREITSKAFDRSKKRLATIEPTSSFFHTEFTKEGRSLSQSAFSKCQWLYWNELENLSSYIRLLWQLFWVLTDKLIKCGGLPPILQKVFSEFQLRYDYKHFSFLNALKALIIHIIYIIYILFIFNWANYQVDNCWIRSFFID